MQISVQLTISSHNMLLKLSNDISRIIRIDCTSVQHMKKAIWAQKHWQPDQHFTPFYPHITLLSSIN
ncbi:uncharacterized protein CIMG_08671 [Coccidioides immitis RS]|uniref:Uncharacterized protein n=1 Tax=Coccidioides immitis (strain RS) TaxID=246410 RepID=J3K5Z9_COCIM|nr:uncharacterized protein CIMG_08671 [Coccidioides immitis RS]EAS29925.3 hypothetical protein CIMG_08671 [Coccidioides immitis RS]